jgi:hypothetical protein
LLTIFSPQFAWNIETIVLCRVSNILLVRTLFNEPVPTVEMIYLKRKWED